MPSAPAKNNCPIGVFDSGVGGLSVLRQLLQQLPEEDIVYLADSAWAPDGERTPEQIAARGLQIADYLLRQHHIKALVVACNTATSQAVQHLRSRWPQLLLIGIEPAIKPAVALSQTGHVGIMATRGTVQSAKFARLLQDWGGSSHIHVQACDGLALAIENALEDRSNPDGQTVHSLCRRYVAALRDAADRATGATAPSAHALGAIDVLVLGCTHYPFAEDVLQSMVGDKVRLIEPGAPVARQTQRLLQQYGLLRAQRQEPQSAHGQHGQVGSDQALDVKDVRENPLAAQNVQQAQHPHQPLASKGQGRLTLLATSAPQRLQSAAYRWLGMDAAVTEVCIDLAPVSCSS
mgnify:CR=1 FL=1